jgi:hypothetical protein
VHLQLTGMVENTYIRTGQPEFDNLIPMVRSFLEKDVLEVIIDGKVIRGYRSPDARSIWIRDYSDMLRGVKYFEPDVTSVVEHFAETQAGNGRIFDYFTTFPEKQRCERENWTKYVRVPVEADVEYRFVKAAFSGWQAMGDDEWISKLLPKMEKALNYTMTHPWRWDSELGLVKRAYTIDTWDFAYTAGRHDWLQFQIDGDTFWGIMHGDNSGYYEAFRLMGLLCAQLGKSVESARWMERAEAVKQAMNRVCWNGRYYTHFVKRTPVVISGVDEAAQLSLSNPMDINRGVATHEMAASIIQEYMKRGDEAEGFAEWYSIDPPFPDGVFGDEKLVRGAYVNGGIMPLVGGELARAAFEHGFEAYGVDILRRYFEMISETGETYLWYFRDGTPASVNTSISPEAEPTDGWGSSAMLYGLVEGLAGIEDRHKLFQKVRLSPRWAGADITKAQVRLRYQASGGYFGYSYCQETDRILLEVSGLGAQVWFHVMMPPDVRAKSVAVEGRAVGHKNVTIESSHYVDFEADIRHQARIEIQISRESG